MVTSIEFYYMLMYMYSLVASYRFSIAPYITAQTRESVYTAVIDIKFVKMDVIM